MNNNRNAETGKFRRGCRGLVATLQESSVGPGAPQQGEKRDRAAGVEIGLPPLVERCRAAGAQRDAQDSGKGEHRMDALRRGERSGPGLEADAAWRLGS